MRVLMYGWEFPPNISGGLGMACFGIVSELARKSVHISFVLPQSVENITHSENVSILGCEHFPFKFDTSTLEVLGDIDVHKIKSLLHPYMSEESYSQTLNHYETNKSLSSLTMFDGFSFSGEYGSNLFSEVAQYALAAGSLAASVPHDVIHAHDWLTVLAGVEARRHSNKPLIFQVHALEPDRSGDNINQKVFSIEKYGMEQADRIVSVSQYTKDIIVERYNIPADKITVVHNGMYFSDNSGADAEGDRRHKMVLFLGRVTHQKGPHFFIEVAKKILAKRKDVQFVVAGSGDLLTDMIEHTAASGIGRHVHYTGFLNQETVQKIYRLADVYVMPSVSEPFGLTCLEALSHDVPVVISKQSGAAEVLKNALKVDFWDTNDMAEKILALLNHSALRDELLKRSKEELKTLTWENTANKLIKVYSSMCMSD